MKYECERPWQKEGRQWCFGKLSIAVSEKILKSCHFSDVKKLSALLCLQRPSQGIEGLRKREFQGLEKMCLQYNTWSAARSTKFFKNDKLANKEHRNIFILIYHIILLKNVIFQFELPTALNICLHFYATYQIACALRCRSQNKRILNEKAITLHMTFLVLE